MERAVSVEEKIRRAEEIYQRRKQGETRPVAKVSVNDKKDIKLLKKMVIQILICVAIYLMIYTIQHNQFVFSNDFINKANEVLSYDTNFMELYQMVKEQVIRLVKKEPERQEEGQVNSEAIGGAEAEIKEVEESQKVEENTEIQNTEANVNIENLSPEEIAIQNIKNTIHFIKPIEGVISSQYGRRESATGNVPKNHTGTDIAANLGTKIKSATDGEVVLASEEGDYGKHLKIQIGEVSIIYAHCNQLYVKQGDKIKQGQEIAEVGSTGNSTGPHLHFEIRISEKTVNPQSILEL